MSGRRIGNYLITDYIGGGGFGSVFKAEDVSTPGRIVAIKELHKKHTRNQVIKQRFFQEAVAMARLDHQNLPRLFTFGEENGSYYLVMEFISGKVLADEIHERGPMLLATAVSISTQVLEALSYAHHNGIIHRDLKPDNILLADDNGTLKVKVLDFGIARMVGGENLTLAGEGFGTPAYMSPERIAGLSGDDPRIDIYAVGIILFELLMGKAPYESSASDPVVYWMEMRDLHEREPLPSLTAAGMPDALDKIVRRATAKSTDDRYASADEMVAELRHAMGESPSAALNGKPAANTFDTRLLLTTAPGGAEVYVDDEQRGASDGIRGKLLIEGLAPGPHSVRVAKDGYSDYRIDIVLGAEQQTDLQVALPARATVAMPTPEDTAAGGFGTSKFNLVDNSTTALLLVEGLPAGSTVYLDANAVAQAGEDGRATVKLAPGAHEVRVTDATGASATKTITVTPADSGLVQTVAMPIAKLAATESATIPLPLAAAAAPVAKPGKPSPARRRAAVGATLALLAALGVGSYFAFRGPAQGNPPPSAPTGKAPEPPPATPNAGGNAGSAKKVEEDRAKAQTDAEKTQPEKKLADAERKPNDEKKAPDKKPAAAEPSTPPPPAPKPVTPAPATSTEDQPTTGNACLRVMVSDANGQPFGPSKLLIVEQSGGGAPSVYNMRTGPNGILQRCGLAAGRRFKVTAFGRQDGVRGALRGTAEITLSQGANTLSVRLNGVADARPMPMPMEPRPGGRRRPRFMRP
jgi:hypothetical protein